jgi:hypothetical protein
MIAFCFLGKIIREAQCMKIILNDCEQASGQTIKYTKYEVYYSINTPNDITEQLSNTSRVSETIGTDKYICMP